MGNGDSSPALYEAIKNDNIDEVNKSLPSKEKINESNADGDTLLTIASRHGSSKVVELLIEKGANINGNSFDTNRPNSFRRGKVNPPLIIAAEKGYLNVVILLVKAKVDIHQESLNRKTAFEIAVENGCVPIVELLLNAGSRQTYNVLTKAAEKRYVEIVKLLLNSGAGEYERSAALIAAVEKGYVEIVKLLLNAGAEENRSTALRAAVEKGYVEIVKLLLNAGTKLDTYGETELMIAAKKGHFSIVILLLEAGANINQIDRNGETALTKAVRSSHLEIVKYLISSGNCDVCKARSCGETPLDAAVKTKNMTIIKYLLQNGAQLTIHNAFLIAIKGGDLNIVKELKDSGALIDVKYTDNSTPLTTSIHMKAIQIARYLIESGVNPDDLNTQQCFFPFMEFVESQDFEMLDFLVEIGLNFNKSDSIGFSPLTISVEKEYLNMIQYLIREGSNIDFVDGRGHTPLAVAASKQDFGIVKYLIDHGADRRLATKELQEFAKCNKNFEVFLMRLNAPVETLVDFRDSSGFNRDSSDRAGSDDNGDTGDRVDRNDSINRSDWGDRSDRAVRGDRGGQSGRGYRHGRGGRNIRGARSDRGGRARLRVPRSNSTIEVDNFGSLSGSGHEEASS